MRKERGVGGLSLPADLGDKEKEEEEGDEGCY